MGAFIVSKDTIDAIVTYAIKGHRRVLTCKALDGSGTVGTRTLKDDQIGQQLWNENVRAVNHSQRRNDMFPRYYFQTNTLRKDKKALRAIDIIKLCHFLEHQSMDSPTWHGSFAEDFLRRTERAAIQDMPEYDKAPWGI